MAKEKSKKEKALEGAGVGGSAATALATKRMYDNGKLTGRETLYHNTNRKNVKSILHGGLKSSYALDPNNLTNKGVKDVSKDEIAGKVYMARKKHVAQTMGSAYALGAAKEHGSAKALTEFANRRTLKARVPMWMMNEVDNPELKGAKNAKEYRQILKDRVKYYEDIGEKYQGSAKLSNSAYNMISRKGTAVIEGDVSPEFFVGNKGYKPFSKSEFKAYVKNHPEEFSKALKNIGAAGIAGATVGAGAYLLNNKKGEKKMKKEAFERLDEAFEKINATGMSPVEKTSFEMLDEAIEKIAERDNKRVAGNATGAMLLGSGGAGFYYANKDRAVASQANKAAKKSFNSAVASSAATLPLTGISLKNTLNNVKGTKELAAAQAQAKNNPGLSSYRDLQKAEDKAKELVKASNKYKKTRSLASSALLTNSFVEGSNFKKQRAIADKALKNSKLKGAAGVAGLGLGAGTLLAANKKKD